MKRGNLAWRAGARLCIGDDIKSEFTEIGVELTNESGPCWQGTQCVQKNKGMEKLATLENSNTFVCVAHTMEIRESK